MSDKAPEQPFFEMGRTDYTHFRVYYTTPNQPTCKDNPHHFPPPKVRPSKKKKKTKRPQKVKKAALPTTDSLSKVEKRFREFEAAKILKSRGIVFTVHDNGKHLIIERYGCRIVDLWPTTGRWIHRLTGESGRGIDILVEYISVP